MVTLEKHTGLPGVSPPVTEAPYQGPGLEATLPSTSLPPVSYLKTPSPIYLREQCVGKKNFGLRGGSGEGEQAVCRPSAVTLFKYTDEPGDCGGQCPASV